MYRWRYEGFASLVLASDIPAAQTYEGLARKVLKESNNVDWEASGGYNFAIRGVSRAVVQATSPPNH